MKIWIITMEDPLYTLDFIKDIIKERHDDIVGLTIAKGGRLKIGSQRSKVVYLLSLLLIMGPMFFSRNVLKTLAFKVKKKLSDYVTVVRSPGLKTFATGYDIPVDCTDDPNRKEYLEKLRMAEPEVIINQSQFILKKELIDIPEIGILNRHNALLPKNRGRLTPFWVLNKGEKETGVSIHFVEEGIDTGDIIVQRKFSVSEKDSFKTVVEKNYEIASEAMLEALHLLENGQQDYKKNDDRLATYNTVPTFKEALKYRIKRIGLSK